MSYVPLGYYLRISDGDPMYAHRCIECGKKVFNLSRKIEHEVDHKCYPSMVEETETAIKETLCTTTD
jgi:hypothetical protein